MRKLKVIFMSIFVLCGFVISFATPGAEPDSSPVTSSIPVRYVAVLPTVSDQDLKEHGAYIRQRVSEPFRYPYYEMIETTRRVPLTRLDLERVAKETGADIVIAPELAHWNQINYPGHPLWDVDWRVRTSCIVRIHMYEPGYNSLKTIEQRYFRTEEESILTSPHSILNEVMNRVMKKFPYERIPHTIKEN